MIPADTIATMQRLHRQGVKPTQISEQTGVRRELVYYYVRGRRAKPMTKKVIDVTKPTRRSVGVGADGPRRSEIPETEGAGYDLDSLGLTVPLHLPWCTFCSGVGCSACGNTGVGAC